MDDVPARPTVTPISPCLAWHRSLNRPDHKATWEGSGSSPLEKPGFYVNLNCTLHPTFFPHRQAGGSVNSCTVYPEAPNNSGRRSLQSSR